MRFRANESAPFPYLDFFADPDAQLENLYKGLNMPLPADAKDLAGVRAWLLDHARSEHKRFEELVRRDPGEFRRIVGGAQNPNR